MPAGAEEEEDVPEPVSVACHACRIVLPLFDEPVARAAWWRFLDEHAYHPVEMLWEHSDTWDVIDIDYIQVDSDIKGDPSFAEYAGEEWTGRPLALLPRPVARAVAGITVGAQDAMDAGRWQAGPTDAAVAERLLGTMDFAPPPDAVVDDAAVAARSAAVHAASERLRRAAAEPLGESFGALLDDLLHTLPPVADLALDEPHTGSVRLAPPRLWDVERALRLVQHLLVGVSLRHAPAG